MLFCLVFKKICKLSLQDHGNLTLFAVSLAHIEELKDKQSPKDLIFSLLRQTSSGGLDFWVVCGPRKQSFHLCIWKTKHLPLTVPDLVPDHMLLAAFICQAYHSLHLPSPQQQVMLGTSSFAMPVSPSIKILFALATLKQG